MIINTSEMIKFYKDFDAVDFKYQTCLYKDEQAKVPYLNYNERYLKYQRHEYAYQFSELTKKGYDSVRANLDLVYAKREITDNTIIIYDLIVQKLINQYINIDGIERMFSEKYADFEWNMHMGINYQKHTMDFYRDHFIHQVRNAYMMHQLLKDGFEDYVVNILDNEANSKISRFVCKHLLQQMETRSIIFENDEVESDVIRRHYLRNIIYMSCYMSALFHDIGYPEAANILNRRRITDYISNIYNLEANYYDFNRISALLQNSLLFRVVSIDDIRKKVEKPDHGALSAIIFLMHFYENGAIHRLEPYKLCAVELAGLAIFNHTAKYMYNEKEKSASHYKISFVLNPISYLLRICDDMQEWDRIYFEISNDSNLIICKNCRTPIIRVNEENKYYYRCNCNQIIKDESDLADEECGVFSTVFRYDAFPYRRVYNVTVCDEVSWEHDGNKIMFKLRYDLENLLHVAYINSSYAKYRIKELNQIKKLFDFQSVMPKVYLDYFVSANPILIKVKIVEVWLKKVHNNVIQEWWESFEYFVEKPIDVQDVNTFFYSQFGEYNNIFSMENYYEVAIDENYKDNLFAYMNKTIKLYGYLCWFVCIYQKVNSNKSYHYVIECENVLERIVKTFKNELKNSFYSEETRCLINDCLVQAKRLYENVANMEFCAENYYKQFEEDVEYGTSLYACCESFVLASKYEPLNEKIRKYKTVKLDAFTDLAMFQKLLKEIRE